VTPLPSTPSQTVGPFFSIGLPWPDGPFAVAPGAPGAVTISGVVSDGAGAPIPDALVETWSPPAAFTRSPTGDDGTYMLRTAKAPYLDVSLFCRGLLHRVVTRIYFADQEAANAADPVLATVPADRRATLLAHRTDDGYRFDIHLQGDGETVFFAV
jgi:protocatechuate 3,4-dioxygenase, alpha subunit